MKPEKGGAEHRAPQEAPWEAAIGQSKVTERRPGHSVLTHQVPPGMNLLWGRTIPL